MKVQAPVSKTNYELLARLLQVRDNNPDLAGKRTVKFQHRLYVK